MSLSRRETEDFRYMLDKSVKKFIGFSEPTLASAAFDCIDRGYDRKKTVDKLTAILDTSQAVRLTDIVYGLWDEFRLGNRSRTKSKRKEDDREERDDSKRRRRFQDEDAPVVQVSTPGNPSPGQLTADKIKEMMANAQKLIQERKTQIQATLPTKSLATVQPDNTKVFMNDSMTKAKRAADLQAKIQARLTGMPGFNPAKQMSQNMSQDSKPTLILNDEGQTIDAMTGQAIQLSLHTPTLKANIQAKRREQFKGLIDKPPEEISDSKFFDPRVAGKGAIRQKRAFKFNEKGKFEQLANRLRTKAQLDRLQTEIAQAAKKTGIASAAKLATIAPKKDMQEGEVPDIEWWDSFIINTDSYDSVDTNEHLEGEILQGVTNLVEHPIQMKPPAEPTKEISIPVYLTKKEREKLRRQNRTEGQKEITEKIRLGLMPPPEPKVRMANLMRVLGQEAVQDPTKIEAHVRAQMAKREKAHEEANAARKLTAEQRREKKMKKIKEDTSLGVHVAVYRVRDLKNPAIKFKVETNANQLFMTGIVILYRDCNAIVIEGGPKQQRKFKRLMLHRIKWQDDKKRSKDNDDNDQEDEEDKVNKCVLVWEGTTKSRNFSEIKFKACPTETFAREQFKKLGVEHYWDLAYSGAVLESTGEDSCI
ncbi:U4/U6 small nuclear ribonucleoprotein Prp3 [Patella vulgata]|uniref:U4/U6 small nuclear ribonucleoprotein Prp3 n=1 Tax=Patella vulgata TaxID=6465 RepID=UPI0021800589|nr:U4/U6 small nuclear ribonucleoprotein Prp3 [Patella vulgata]